jgi:hypothetical protein
MDYPRVYEFHGSPVWQADSNALTFRLPCLLKDDPAHTIRN